MDLGAATFSPDDSQVAVEAERSRGIGELLILDRGTGEFRPVAGIKSPAATGTIAWSSDGRSLVFEEEFEKNSEVWTIDLRNGVLQKIGAGFNPSWSPDGKWIAYFTEDGQKCILAHPDGTGAHVLKDLGNRFFGYRRFGYAAVWSPDSTRLLLNEMKGDGDYIDVVLVDVQSHRAVRKSKNGWPVFGWANPPK